MTRRIKKSDKGFRKSRTSWRLFLISVLVLLFLGLEGFSKTEISFNPSVKQLPSNEEIFGWIKDLCNLGYRRPGTEAGYKTAQYIMKKFQEFGLEQVQLQAVDIPLWSAEKWNLVVNGEKFPCFYMVNSYWIKEFGEFSTGPEGIKAEMVYVGEGRERDFRNVDVKGKIVVSEVRFTTFTRSDFERLAYFSYDPDNTIPQDWQQLNPYLSTNFPGNLHRAIKKGAVGFIGILTDYFDRNTYYNERYGQSPGAWTIPGLWLSKSDGERLKELLKNNPKVEAQMALDGKIVPAKAYNVLGFLSGKTDEVILIHSHHDAPFASAVEDASGVAEVLALAKYFAQFPKEKREKTLMFVTTDTHFSMYQAHSALIKKIKQEKINLIIDLAIEHIGKTIIEKDGELIDTGMVEIRGFFVTENPYLISLTKQVMEKNRLSRTVILPTYLGVPTDASDFHEAGYSIISLISPPMYIYDEIDTPDKIAIEELNPVATAFADIIESIDQTPAKVVNQRSWIPKYRFRFYHLAMDYLIDYIKNRAQEKE